MPKRQNTSNTVEILAKKLKKLEKEIKNSRRRGRRRSRVLSTSSNSSCSSRSASPCMSRTPTPRDSSPDPETIKDQDTTEPAPPQATPLDVDETEAPSLAPPASPLLPTPHHAPTSTDVVLPSVLDQVNESLDPDILDILGTDPTSVQEYGADINKELATRLVHLATSGLDKEKRKELIDNYLVPANCAQVAAPRLNPEIKAAVAETVVKRDKAIETRQTEIAAAISCLGQTISSQLVDKNKDHELLKQLMDTARILCDIQYNESISRRNFTLYSLKKEMKEQLTNTKVDTFLFGENLPETIKTAKAVTKSVSDLKVEPSKKSRPSTSAPSSKNLNWKTGFGNRRPTPGPQRRPPPGSCVEARQLVARLSAASQADAPPIDTATASTSKPQPEHQQQRYPGGRSIIRTALLRGGSPASAIDIMLASLSDNTLKQYDGCFKKWFMHCMKNNIDMFAPSVPIIIEYLTDIFNSGSQFSTMNCYRAALSILVGPIAQDERLSRFFKGIYRLRPPTPRYNITWDASKLLDYLATLHPNESLSLEQLSKKCSTLLALVTAHRVQTLSKINIKNIIFSTSQIIIKIPDLIKTSKLGNRQPTLFLPFFEDRPAICPANTLKFYINKSKDYRKSDKLFISIRKPHNCVTSQTLSRWIKTTLKDSGIDVSVFSAHSTRHAATSMAYKLGVNLDVIRNTAGWSGNSTTFARFYNRNITNDDDCSALARTILCSL